MRPLLSLLLLALPHLALSLPASPAHAARELKRLNLPYPSGDTPATCPHPADRSNLFTRNGFTPVLRTHHRLNINPPPTFVGASTDNPLELPRRTLTHVCQQVAGFLFLPLAATTVKTEDVLLRPGKRYVFSVAADVPVQNIVAWAWDAANPKPGGQMRFLGSAHPGLNSGTLVLAPLESAVKVFFVVLFGSLHGRGEVGLFAIGSG